MATRLTLLCHAATPTMREGGFPPPDETLDAAALRRLARHPLAVARPERILSSPARAARDTATALGGAVAIDPVLRDMAHGDWSGCSFAAVHARDPGRFEMWIADPAAGAPGGETLGEVRARIGPWLAAQAGAGGATVAVTHPMVIRAILSAALDLPAAATLSIDIAPLASVVLSFNRAWRLQAIRPD